MTGGGTTKKPPTKKKKGRKQSKLNSFATDTQRHGRLSFSVVRHIPFRHTDGILKTPVRERPSPTGLDLSGAFDVLRSLKIRKPIGAPSPPATTIRRRTAAFPSFFASHTPHAAASRPRLLGLLFAPPFNSVRPGGPVARAPEWKPGHI